MRQLLAFLSLALFLHLTVVERVVGCDGVPAVAPAASGSTLHTAEHPAGCNQGAEDRSGQEDGSAHADHTVCDGMVSCGVGYPAESPEAAARTVARDLVPTMTLLAPPARHEAPESPPPRLHHLG
jgi:hypothetical protein